MARQFDNENLTGIFSTASLSFVYPDLNASTFKFTFVVHGSGSLSRINGVYKQGYRSCYALATVQDEETLNPNGRLEKTRTAKLERPICEIIK